MKKLLLSLLLIFTPTFAVSSECITDENVTVDMEKMGRRVMRAIDCFEGAIEEFEAENQKLAARVEELEAALLSIPKEFSNEDGASNDAVPPYSTATFVLTASPRSRVTSLDIHQPAIEDMCADTEGCFLQLFVRPEEGEDFLDLEEQTCGLKYAESGGWKLSGECGGVSGIDGDALLPGAEGNSAQFLLRIGNLCGLGESDVSLNPGDDGLPRLSRDRQQGLVLLSGFVVDPDAPVSGDHSCVLAIRD